MRESPTGDERRFACSPAGIIDLDIFQGPDVPPGSSRGDPSLGEVQYVQWPSHSALPVAFRQPGRLLSYLEALISSSSRATIGQLDGRRE